MSSVDFTHWGGLDRLSNVELAAVAAYNALPRALGLVAWTVDPRIANLSATQNNVHAIAVYLGRGDVINNLAVPVATAGTGMTHAQLGIYDAGLNVVASSADSPNSFSSATGWVSLALTATYVVPSTGMYYFASAYAASTSTPTVVNIQQNGTIGGATLPGSGKYTGIHGAAQGTLPNPIASVSTFSNVPVIIAY